jgi:preprotein translocase subunit SecG
MFTFLSVVYVLVCAFLVLVVLLQSGKGGGMGAIGGGASTTGTVFGGAGAGNFLTRLTAICAALFMILSATLAYLSTSGEKSLDDAAQTREEREAAVNAAAAEGGGAEPEPGAMSESEEAAADDEEPAADDEEPAAADEAEEPGIEGDPVVPTTPAEPETPDTQE